MEAYFDNSATTIVTDSVKDIVVKTMTEDFGNPSAMHMVGVKAEKYIKEAQENIAKILKVDPKEIFFTSGGTESNNMAIIGTAMANKRKGNKIITTSVEHSSVLATMKYLEEQGFEVIYLPVDRYGVVQMEALEKEMTEDTILVSTMYVNNEVGAIEPVGEIGQYIKKVNPSVVYHVDAIQALGEIHKFYPDRISGTCVGSIAFSPIAVRKDDRIIKMAEYHTTTWEGIVALDDDMIIHVAPASGGTPVPELAKAFIVPKGCMVKINAAIWHLCPLPLNNDELHAMIILPECTYANDCTVVDFEEKDWFKITV